MSTADSSTEIFAELHLDMWREVCQHIDIEHAAARIARIIKRHIRIDQLVVLEFDWTRCCIILRAIAFQPDSLRIPTVRHIESDQQRRLLAWTRKRELLLQKRAGPVHQLSALLLSGQPEGEWLIVPLGKQDHAGALLVRAKPTRTFESSHVRMFHSMIKPLSAALENTRRLHELNALREAAEAEKRLALSRLGRTELRNTIIGADGGLKPVMERIGLVAKSDIPVLIFGETGSGKEVIARAIHNRSPRAKHPFIRVNCGAIPPELIDSELFGHKKGAFTGAIAMRQGWFERADEGTLLLDEIGELPLAAQVRLLRVLQEGAFQRVGGEKPIRVDVRIIAATHRDLPGMVQSGKFREDLWYRISGFPLVLPPLRERKRDIPVMAEHFAQRAALRFGLKYQSPSREDHAALIAYDWPGNVRELASVIDRAAILGDGESLEIERALGIAHVIPEPQNQEDSDLRSNTGSSVATLDEAMSAHIQRVLRLTHGRIEGRDGAAELLRINPHTLRARMRKLKIRWSEFRD